MHEEGEEENPCLSPRSFRDLAANEALAATAMLQLLGVGALLLVPGAQHRPAPRRRCRACVAAEPVPLPTSPKDVATQMSYAVQAALAPSPALAP